MDSATRFFTSSFFIKLLFLALRNTPGNDFDFFQINIDIFDNFGTSSVSFKPEKQVLPV
jgi:hypothetical protein